MGWVRGPRIRVRSSRIRVRGSRIGVRGSRVSTRLRDWGTRLWDQGSKISQSTPKLTLNGDPPLGYEVFTNWGRKGDRGTRVGNRGSKIGPEGRRGVHREGGRGEGKPSPLKKGLNTSTGSTD